MSVMEQISVFRGVLKGLETAKARLIIKKKQSEEQAKEELNDPQNEYLGWTSTVKPYIETLIDVDVANMNIIEEYNTLIEQLEEYLQEQSLKEDEYDNAIRIVTETSANIEELEKELNGAKATIETLKREQEEIRQKLSPEVLELLESKERVDPGILAMRDVNKQKILLADNPYAMIKTVCSNQPKTYWPRRLDFLPAKEGLINGLYDPQTTTDVIKLDSATLRAPRSAWWTTILEPVKKSVKAERPKDYYVECVDCQAHFLDDDTEQLKGQGKMTMKRVDSRCHLCRPRWRVIKKNNERCEHRDFFIEPQTGLRVREFERYIGPIAEHASVVTMSEEHFRKQFEDEIRTWKPQPKKERIIEERNRVRMPAPERYGVSKESLKREVEEHG